MLRGLPNSGGRKAAPDMMTVVALLAHKETSLDAGQKNVDFHSFELMHKSSAGCDLCLCKIMLPAINAKGNIELLRTAL